MSDEREADELSAQQHERAAREDRLAREAPEEDEAEQHQRRADKARYLREKLQERSRSEREQERE